MNKSVKIFLNILSIAGLAVWTVMVCLGVHYAAECNWLVSIPVALVVGLLMAFLLYMARMYSQPKKSGNYGTDGVVRKWVFFGLYCLVSLISAWWLLHAVAVGTTLKEQVQPRAKTQLTELRTMISETTSAGGANGSYMEFVDSRLANYRSANPFSRRDASELNSDLLNLKDNLVKNSGYAELAAHIKDFGERADYAISSWDLLDIWTVGSYVDELGRRKPEWEAALVECSQKGYADDFTDLHVLYVPLSTHDPELAAPLFNTSASNITFAGILIMLALQLVILLSWIAVSIDEKRAPTGVGESQFITTWKN